MIEALVHTASFPLKWTAAGGAGLLTLGNGGNNATSTGSIPIADASEVMIFLEVAGVTNVYAFLQFGPDGTKWGIDLVEEVPVLSGVQRTSALSFKQWGPLAPLPAAGPPGIAYPIARPVCAHFMRLWVYAAAAPAGGDYVQASIERQGIGQLGAAQGI